MPTRRALLKTGSGTLAAALLGRCGLRLAGQTAATTPAPKTADDMTVNSAPQPAHYPPPDFGPTPAVLPPATLALRGANSLQAHGRRHGLIAGAAVTVNSLLRDPALQQLVAEQYAILVPETELKWRALRPAPATFDFSVSDQLFAFAKSHSMLVRGHTLVWHNSVPDWLIDKKEQFDVRQLLVEHIRTVMGRYRGRVHSWDVVNEAILPSDKDRDGMRRSFWFDAVGPDYVELAFRTAREADPHAKLTYNDYGVEYDNDDNAERRKYILALVQSLRAKGVPIDAVGIQAHIHAGSQYPFGRGIADYIEAIRAMGLEVYITEMDVNEDDIASDDVARRDQAVADTYREFLDVALTSSAVKLMLTWGVSSRRTWLNDGPTHHRKQPNRPQRSLPFDPEYAPTPAFFAIRDSFDRRARM